MASRPDDMPSWATLPGWLQDYERSVAQRGVGTPHVVRAEDREDLDKL